MAADVGPLLIVCPFCLDHVGHGNIQRILALGRYLAANGAPVDLVYQGRARVPRVDAQYSAFRRAVAAAGRAPSSEEAEHAERLATFYGDRELPRPIMRPSAPLTALARSFMDTEPYVAAIGVYAFAAPIFANLRRRVLTICDVQDVIHAHGDGAVQATGQAGRFEMPAATEGFLWRQWDVLVAITPEDERRIRPEILPHQHLVSARHAAIEARTASPGRDDVAFYAGSNNSSNVHAVTWLLERVWPLVRRARPAATLRVAGLICSALPAQLQHEPGVEVLGFQQDIDGETAACGVVVAPYLYGSGLKIKVVEAACAGKAIVTTSAGMVGTGLEKARALEAHDEPEAFANALSRLLGDRIARETLGEHARIQASTLFSAGACYAPIRLAIERLGSAAG